MKDHVYIVRQNLVGMVARIRTVQIIQKLKKRKKMNSQQLLEDDEMIRLDAIEECMSNLEDLMIDGPMDCDDCAYNAGVAASIDKLRKMR